MKEIELTQNKVVIVDDDDYEWILSFGKWQAVKGRNTFYAYKHLTGGKQIIMHRLIMNRHFGESILQVDHKNHNGLDNRKENLRYVTQSQNSMNRPKRRVDFSSQFKGVSYYKQTKRWVASIRILDKDKTIGYFNSERLAGIAYDIYAEQYYKDFFICNVKDATKEEIILVKEIISNVKKIKGKSKYRGVCFVRKKWNARIIHNKKRIYIGDFDSEEEAALAYNKMALELKGKDAKLNILTKDE